MNTKQGRDKLKTYFETGDRPTEDEFSEFIDSGINQLDDNVHAVKQSNGITNIGIGTDAPDARLEVNGNVNVTGHVFGKKAAGTEDFLMVSNSAEIQLFGSQHTNRKGDVFLIGDHRHGAGSGKISFDQRISDTQWRNNLLIDANGNVGIGTTTPGNKLEIVPGSGSNLHTGLKLSHGAGVDKLLVSDANGNARWEQPTNLTNGFWTKNGNHIGNTNTGNVGVGVPNPIGKLQVNDGMSRLAIGSAYQINSNGSSNTGYGTGYLGFNAARNGGNWQLVTDGANNGGALMYSDVGGSINLVTFPSSGSGTQNIADTDMVNHIRMKIDATGNVGIGTRLPKSKLDVEGNVSINDNSLYLRDGTDKYHGIQFNAQTDGPHLFGNRGGALTTKKMVNSSLVETKTMEWFHDQSVDFKGNVKVNGYSPFLVERKKFVENDNLHLGINLGKTSQVYGAAVVVGFKTTKANAAENDFGIYAYTYLLNGVWHIKADMESQQSGSGHESWEITIMYIVKEMVSWTPAPTQ